MEKQENFPPTTQSVNQPQVYPKKSKKPKLLLISGLLLLFLVGMGAMYAWQNYPTLKILKLIPSPQAIIYSSLGPTSLPEITPPLPSDITPTQTLKVVVTTDKKEYEQGEEVKATLNYDTRIFVWQGYEWSIQKWENGSWVNILIKDFGFHCSNTPECKDVNFSNIEECPSMMLCEGPIWYEVKDTPLTWDQSYKKEEKTFQCKFIQRLPGGRVTSEEIVSRTCAVFGQVPSGKYKIRFEYALAIDPNDPFNRDIKIEYAEREFTIK